MNFFVEIGARAKRVRRERQRNKPNLLPLSKDVMALTNYLTLYLPTVLISTNHFKTL
jgi:hypothetical protein